MTARERWEDRARCRGYAATFFPKDDNGHGQTARAIAICSGCSVRSQCLSYALKLEGNAPVKNRYWVWGGMTPEQRKEASDKRAQQSTATS
jgi:WhiB family redox-sensing transcriptional regulator